MPTPIWRMLNAVRALLLDGAESTALNLGTGRGWSVRELVASVRDVTGCNIPVPVGAPRPGDPPVLIADASRARHQLAWRPSYSNLSSHVMHAWAAPVKPGSGCRNNQCKPPCIASIEP